MVLKFHRRLRCQNNGTGSRFPDCSLNFQDNFRKPSARPFLNSLENAGTGTLSGFVQPLSLFHWLEELPPRLA